MPPVCGHCPKYKLNIHLDPEQIRFHVQHHAVAFNISRMRTGNPLFMTVDHGIVFWPQFLHVNMALSRMAKVYSPSGHSEPMRINVCHQAWQGSHCVHLVDSYD